MTNHTLPQDVAARFRLIDWKGSHRQDFGRFGTVDLHTITVQQAERLVARGFKKLVEITVKSRAAKSDPVPDPTPPTETGE